jgi:hypothetical protein
MSVKKVIHDLFPLFGTLKKPRFFKGCLPPHPAADHRVHGLRAGAASGGG